jgi:hypothetical protein
VRNLTDDEQAEFSALCDKLARCLVGHRESIVCLAFMRGLASALSWAESEHRDELVGRVTDELPLLINSLLTGAPMPSSSFFEMRPAQLQ